LPTKIVSGLDVSTQAQSFSSSGACGPSSTDSRLHQPRPVGGRVLCDEVAVMSNGEIVERGRRPGIRAPQHRNTRALLDSVRCRRRPGWINS